MNNLVNRKYNNTVKYMNDGSKTGFKKYLYDIGNTRITYYVGMALISIAVLLFLVYITNIIIDKLHSKQQEKKQSERQQQKQDKPKLDERLLRSVDILGTLPNKDEYMTPLLRQQLDMMENKFYYDNCRFELD